LVSLVLNLVEKLLVLIFLVGEDIMLRGQVVFHVYHEVVGLFFFGLHMLDDLSLRFALFVFQEWVVKAFMGVDAV